MRRKIAAILAADIAGYSRLVAEDEEETLRRLAVYRGVFEDFVSRAGGRVFNTAGDGFLAEFPSAVDAVRCAIDAQESLRTRNLAYPPSRQMAFRMGLTIGDVVDRDGDLLGDGVNIAARLQTLAEPGRICISKSVYDAVANKLSVQFTDLGAQQVKNIPNPVHVFGVSTGEVAQPKPATIKLSGKPKVGPVTAAAAIAGALLAGAAIAMLAKTVIEPAKKTTGEAATKPAAVAASQSDDASKARSGSQIEATKAPVAEPSAAASVTPATASPPTTDIAANNPKPVTANQSDDVASMGRLRPRWWSECKGDDRAAAIRACRQLIDNGGVEGTDLALAYEKLAYAQRQGGQIDDAIASFTTSISTAESASAYNERGTAYFLKGQVNDAMADYDRAIALDGTNGNAFNNRAWVNYKLGRIKEAKADADRAQSLSPAKADVYDTRGHIFEALGDRAAAIKSFEKALSLDSTLQSSEAALKRLGAR